MIELEIRIKIRSKVRSKLDQRLIKNLSLNLSQRSKIDLEIKSQKFKNKSESNLVVKRKFRN